MNFEDARALRAMLLAAVPHARVRLRDDDDPQPTVGDVVEMTDDLWRQLYGQAGDDVTVMVWVRWSRTHVRPEYVEDLVRILS
jgi:hypothetical protein